MKRICLLAVVVAALTLTASSFASSSAHLSTRSLSDVHVGWTKSELVTQRDFSQRIVKGLTGSWLVAPRHATCWSHVPWSHVCNRARQKLIAHRWLAALAQRRIDKLYPPPWSAPQSFLSQAKCVHGYEGAWNDDTGNGFGGGLQFMVGTWNRAAALSGGSVPYVKTTGDIAKEPPSVQIHAAYLIVSEDGSWQEWPNTGRACGLL